MTTPGIKSPVQKTTNSNKITESELIILLPKIFRAKKKKKLIFASEFDLLIPIKGHPFSVINRINYFLLKI
jgi:hypothetical protein